MADTKCWQCERPYELLMEFEGDDAGWVLCSPCGARIMTHEDFRADYDAHAEERAKKALGFYDFKPAADRAKT